MDISHISSLEQMKDFLKVTFNVRPDSKEKTYSWLRKLLLKIHYAGLGRKEKKLVKQFIEEVTGYSQIQIKRLIRKHKNGTLLWKKWQKKEFTAKYSEDDISLLHGVDRAHRLSGPATKKILQRECEVFGKKEYEKLKEISVSHIYNLRKRPDYLRRGQNFDKTRSTQIPIGKRIKPRPNGRPGFFRVDTVHQGDLNKDKGIYYINIVDEVTQSEFVFSVPAICERYLKIVLERLFEVCPFVIINFHSDNGSEYINKVVADILNRLHIHQTKSRPRKHNDNALVETKNGSIIRKTFGYAHIPATEENAGYVNQFCQNWLNDYLNYHRPCGFATTKYDHKGKEKKIYETYMTPYEKLKSLPDGESYLRKGLSFENLDMVALRKSDTEFALEMNEAKARMYLKLRF